MKELKVRVFWNSTMKFWQADTDDDRHARGKTRGEALKILGEYVEKTDVEAECVHTEQITLDNLPTGPRWEADGACWTALKDDNEPSGWRWRPNNPKALGKESPTGPLIDHYPYGL